MLLASTCVRCLLCQDYEQYRPSSWLTEVEPKSSPYYPQVGDAVSRVICEESISSLIPEQCSEEVHCAVQYWHINLKCNMVLHLSILCGDILGHLCQCILVPAAHSTYVRLCSLMHAAYCGGVIHTLHFGTHALFLFLQVMYFRQGHEQYLQEVRKEQVFSTRGMQLPWQHFDLRVCLGLVT